MKLNIVLVAMILNIDRQDQSEIIRLHAIIHRIVSEIILVEETETMDPHHVIVTILLITLLHETILPVIANTHHLVDATTSCHELTMILTWVHAVMLPGTVRSF